MLGVDMRLATATVTEAGASALRRRHPWVFGRAVAQVSGDPGPGDTVDILAPGGTPVARGAYSPASQIRVRVWTFDPAERVDAAFFRSRLDRAIAARRELLAEPGHTACRLVNAESDGLPGVVVDRYGDTLVCQLLAAGAERWRQELVAALVDAAPCRSVYERSDADVRAKEGLEPRTGLVWGAEPPELVEIHERGLHLQVDVRCGHKTGFYLDQRCNRARVAAHCRGAEVLNCFSYTGAFSVAALAAGAARVTEVETSAPALALARRHLELNGLEAARLEQVEGNVFAVLRGFRDRGRQFDLVILDPPKFAESRAQLAGASRGYKDVNLLAFKLLRPGGRLFTFSCSGLVSAELFQKIVADAALDAGREVQLLERLGQASDHPTALPFPEGTYLKGLICRVT
jgi:23S rRNA (cytosine1962-C5)-methyltransferase